jgi:hypothetical protein
MDCKMEIYIKNRANCARSLIYVVLTTWFIGMASNRAKEDWQSMTQKMNGRPTLHWKRAVLCTLQCSDAVLYHAVHSNAVLYRAVLSRAVLYYAVETLACSAAGTVLFAVIQGAVTQCLIVQ